MKMKKGNTRYLVGLFTFLLVNVSFMFLLASPYVENTIGMNCDRRLIHDLDQRIEEVRKGDFNIDFIGPDGLPLKNIRVAYRHIRHEFIFGCNIFSFNQFGNPEQNRLYKEHFRGLFNLAVLPFYWKTSEPEQGNLVKDEFLREVLDWCELNGIRTKGHPLVWRNPAGYPEWLPDDKRLVTDLMKARIQSAIEKYGDRIKIWDVVNEPTHLPPFGDQSVFGYVNSSFRWAYEKAPDALLTINDYGILGHDFGHGPYGRLIGRLLVAGAPVRCIGLQGREPRTDWVPAYEIKASLDAYSRFGLPLHITEITVPSAALPITNSWKKGVWTPEEQAEYLERLYKVCFSHHAVQGIIYWDLYDGLSWIKNGGLIYLNWEPKPAYIRLSRLINEKWRTKGEGLTDEKGQVRFRGFYGTYEILLPEYGRTFKIKAWKSGASNFRLQVSGE